MASEADTDDVVQLRVDSIYRDPRFQVRRKLDQATVERYAKVYESGNQMPPVEVALINQSYVLLEGWHRLAALDKLGWDYVDAIVRKCGKREARWLAAKANLTHGLPLKSSELREVFRQYVRARKYRNKDGSLRSYREIASDLGGLRAHTTIRNWMRKDFPRLYREYAEDELPTPLGGLRDAPAGPDPKEVARTSVNQALAAYGALDSEIDRQEVVGIFKEALQQLEHGEALQPVDYPEDF